MMWQKRFSSLHLTLQGDGVLMPWNLLTSTGTGSEANGRLAKDAELVHRRFPRSVDGILISRGVLAESKGIPRGVSLHLQTAFISRMNTFFVRGRCGERGIADGTRFRFGVLYGRNHSTTLEPEDKNSRVSDYLDTARGKRVRISLMSPSVGWRRDLNVELVLRVMHSVDMAILAIAITITIIISTKITGDSFYPCCISLL